MNTPDLWRRSRELTEEIAALEATGKVNHPKGEQPYVAWPSYAAAVIHQNRVKERAVLIGQLRHFLGDVGGELHHPTHLLLI